MTASPEPEIAVVFQAFQATLEVNEEGTICDRVVIERAGPYEYMLRAWLPNDPEFIAYREEWNPEMGGG